jgi:hypothetical protein
MNYATQHHSGNYHSSRAEIATAVAPTVGRVRQVATKTKGCKPGAERQTEVRTSSNAANGILKCTFLPKLRTEQSLQACEEDVRTERDFYKSLSKMARHYQIEPMQTKGFGFPYNITLSMWDMEAKVKCINPNWDGYKLVQDTKKNFLVTEERYNTGTTLYYIPVVPLFRMLYDKKRKHAAQLLLSVCSYLYHIADIPYYRQEDSYLYWLYETHKDWMEQDEETDDTQTYLSDFIRAEYVGDRIEQKLFNRNNLTFFEHRLNHFKSHTPFEQECWQVANNAFALYTEFPTASIFRNAPMTEQDPYNDEGYENETIGMEKYISFIADTKGWLYESLSDSINNEFNEYGTTDEPTIRKNFDGSKVTQDNLDFENRLFALMDDLCTVLCNY